MAIYEYRCEQHGPFDVSRPLGTAAQTEPCPECGAAASRVISAPMVRSSARNGVFAAIERADKSRHEPEVVTSLPRTGVYKRTPMATMTPQRARLPRP